jgi:putative inorganic carbon (HCO3(-)) transporter
MASQSTGRALASGQRDVHTGRSVQAALDVMAATIIVPAALFLSRAVQRVLLGLLLLNIPLQVQKHYFLREDISDLGSLGGLQVSLTNLSLLGLLLGWIGSTAVRPVSNAFRRGSSLPTLPAVLLVLAYVASVFAATDRALAMFEIMIALEVFLLYLYVANVTTSIDDVSFIVRILLIGLIVQSAIMLAQIGGALPDFDAYGIRARAAFAGDSRVSGTIGSPNPAAAYLAMMMTLSLGVMLSNAKRRDKALAGAALAMATLPLIFTQSRGGWVAFVTGAAIMVIVGGRRLARRTLTLAAVTLLVLVLPFGSFVQQRLSGDDNGSSAARMPLNHLAGAMIESHPVAGVGANNFATAMTPYARRAFGGEFLYTVHNKYLLVWAETGIVGLIAFLWFLTATLREGARCWQLRDAAMSPQALGCTAAVAGMMVQLNFDPFRTGAEHDLIWLFAGLVVAMGRAAQAGVDSDRESGGSA